ncbi:hypothetical protein TSMEX_006180, partial [Taenia solium]
CRARNAKPIAQPEKPKKEEKKKKKKKKKKAKRSGRQAEVDLSDRHPANSASPQDTANAEVDVSCYENSVSTEERDSPVAELLPESKTSKKKKKKKQGERKSGNRNKRHPVQHHAQPAIDPSRIAKLSETHNYLRTVKARSKQKQRELGSVCQKIAGLEDELRDCHAEGADLVEKEACYARRLEKLQRVEHGLDREIKNLGYHMHVMLAVDGFSRTETEKSSAMDGCALKTAHFFHSFDHLSCVSGACLIAFVDMLTDRECHIPVLLDRASRRYFVL